MNIIQYQSERILVKFWQYQILRQRLTMTFFKNVLHSAGSFGVAPFGVRTK